MGWIIAAIAIAGLLAVYTIASGSRTRTSGSQAIRAAATKARISAQNKTLSAAQRGRYAAVSVRAGMSACPAALEIDERRYLRGQAPSLPLAECVKSQCGCRFVEHDDRRNSEAEDRRMGLGLQSQLYGSLGQESKRGKSAGRRSTDY